MGEGVILVFRREDGWGEETSSSGRVVEEWMGGVEKETERRRMMS